MRILLLPASYTSPSARYRVWQFIEPLRSLGHEVEVRVVHPQRTWQSSFRWLPLRKIHGRAGTAVRLMSAAWALRDAQSFDVIFMNRDVIPETRIDVIESLLARRNPCLVFDLDDAIYLGDRDRKLRSILPHFAAVIAGNEELAGYLRQHNPNVTVIPTVVNGEYYEPALLRATGPIRLGWSGSAAPLREYVPALQKSLERLATTHEFDFVVICNQRPTFRWRSVRTQFIEWRPETEVEDLQRFDVGLMPLTDGPFERAKCAAKAILYMAVGIPAVVSPVGVNTEVVRHGETGFHCSGETEWHDCLSSLIQNADLRRRMGSAGRARFEQAYSLEAVLPAWLGVLEQVASLRVGPSSISPRERAITSSGGVLSSR